MLFFYVLLNIFQLSFTDFATHKFYLSTTEIEYKKELKTFQIMTQLFIDDLELLLQQQEKSLRLFPDSNAKHSDSLLIINLKKEFQLIINGEPQEISYLGKEYKNDIVVCYLELYLDEIPSTIEIKNSMFFDLFDSQQNIIHYKNEASRNSFLLHSKSPTLAINLSN